MNPSHRTLMISVLALAILSACARFAPQDAPLVDEHGFIRSWLLCGPFPNPPGPDGERHSRALKGFYTDYLPVHGGESALTVAEGDVTSCGVVRTWFAHTAPEHIVRLDDLISNDDDILAYGVTNIVSPDESWHTLAVGSNNGVRVWLNGDEVIDNPGIGSLSEDSEVTPVRLRAGRNQLLLKVEEGRGQWEFCARLKPFRVDDYLERDLFDIERDDEAGVTLRYRGHPDHAPLTRAALTLLDRRRPEAPVWQAPWPREVDTPLPVDADKYGEYALMIDLDFPDGVPDQRELNFTTGRRPERVLFDAGRTSYTIVLAESASQSERWAAEQLARRLEEIGGASVPIVDDDAPLGPCEIVVGFNRHTRLVLGGDAPDAAPDADDERFTVQSHGPHVLIHGGARRGTMYGVFTFLERELGCRWYASDAVSIPQRARWAFAQIHHDESPGIALRAVDYFDVYDSQYGPANKVNAQRFHRGDQPGGLERLWLEHSFDVFVPVAEFFDTHPEYFSLRDGQRLRERTQLCLTQPDVLTILTERLRAYMREHTDYVVYNVAQNDNQNFCQCDACQAVADRFDGQCGLMLWFVNQVADAVRDEFPDRYVGTFAYQYTRRPPTGIRPRDNVLVTLCSIECDFAHPFTHPHNATFLDDLKTWSTLTDHLFIWDYVINYTAYMMPHPNFGTLQDNVRIMRDHHVVCILEQANTEERSGEFAELRAWVVAKLLWDPEADVRALIEDFMAGYYGRSGAPLLRYFDDLHSRVRDDTYLSIWTRPSLDILNRAFLRRAEALFDEAEAVADNPTIRRRVERERLALLYLSICRDTRAAVARGDLRRFLEIVRREGITRVWETGTIEDLMEAIRKQHPELDLPSTP